MGKVFLFFALFDFAFSPSFKGGLLIMTLELGILFRS